mgnify:FL=1
MADSPSDGDTAATQAEGAAAPKKRTRTASSTPRAPRAKKSTKATSKSRAAKEDASPELPLESAPAPAPEQRAPEAPAPAAPEPQSEAPREVFKPRRERAPEASSAESAPESSGASEKAPASESPAPAPARDFDSSESAPAAQAASSEAPAAPAEGTPAEGQRPPQNQGGGDQPQQPQGNRQGGNPNEPFWKRDKRGKRNRGKHGGNGGNWQQHERPKHPQQPPPPNLNPVVGDLPDAARFADLEALAATANEIASGGGEPLYVDHLYTLTLHDLTAEARRLGVAFEGAPNRKQLLAAIFKFAAEAKRPIFDRGYIDLTDKGHGFIVHPKLNYRVYPEDSYLPESLIKQLGLKRGHEVEVQVEAPRENERCPSVVRIVSVMGRDPAEISKVTPFEELIPYYPLKRILLEAPEIHKDVSMRTVDILTPIGFGQRGLIVAPPRTGKTVLLQNMANSISHNFPEAKLILLLIDERPEEVTDFKRHTKGEVVSSTFDESPESHVHCAEMVGEKARRLVEQGEHVVILLDSITRLARAYNALASNSGKIMSGGMEATALQRPKRFFGAARNIEGGGSLTIMATALIDTGSRMDEVIFEEFKGTGNMELHLDRGLVDKRIFPAINGDRSGTRKEELIYHPDEILRIHGLRRAMQGIPPVEAMEMLINRLKKTKTNAEFLMSLNR